MVCVGEIHFSLLILKKHSISSKIKLECFKIESFRLCLSDDVSLGACRRSTVVIREVKKKQIYNANVAQRLQC